MATANPSPASNGDTADKRTDHERIRDVGDLDVGDRILVDDRSRPLVVDSIDARERDTMRGPCEHHTAEASGEWSDARTLTLTTQLDIINGEPSGEIVVDGIPRPVWRVNE